MRPEMRLTSCKAETRILWVLVVVRAYWTKYKVVLLG